MFMIPLVKLFDGKINLKFHSNNDVALFTRAMKYDTRAIEFEFIFGTKRKLS